MPTIGNVGIERLRRRFTKRQKIPIRDMGVYTEAAAAVKQNQSSNRLDSNGFSIGGIRSTKVMDVWPTEL